MLISLGRLKNRHWLVLLIVSLFVICFFGLRPKPWMQSNNVRYSPERGALVFNSPSIAYVDDFKMVLKENKDVEFKIDLDLVPANILKIGSRHILLLHGGNDQKQLVVWSWGDSLIIMNGDDYDYTRRWNRLVVNNIFQSGQRVKISVVSGEDGSRLYVDGQLFRSVPWTLNIPSVGEEKLRLVLGNSVYGKSSWKGQIYSASFYLKRNFVNDFRTMEQSYTETDDFLKNNNKFNSFADFSFSKCNASSNNFCTQVLDSSGTVSLVIPEYISLLNRSAVLSFKYNFRSKGAGRDIILNIMGFIPLGFFLCSLLLHLHEHDRAKVVFYTFFICFLISIFIEILQAWIPGRSSSMFDLVLNSFGAIIGAFCCNIKKYY